MYLLIERWSLFGKESESLRLLLVLVVGKDGFADLLPVASEFEIPLEAHFLLGSFAFFWGVNFIGLE